MIPPRFTGIHVAYILYSKLATISFALILGPFYNSGCPPFFNDTDCFDLTFQEASDIYPKTADLSVERQAIHVANLNRILSSFEESHFLVILTTFREVTFEEPSYPIILRYLRLVRLWTRTSGDWWPLQVFYVLDEFVKQKINYTSYYKSHYLVQGSKFWEKDGGTDVVYSVLNTSSYLKDTRPWNNLVSIHVFPEVQLIEMTKDDRAFIDHMVHPIHTFYSIFPSALPNLKIIVLRNSDIHPSNQLTKVVEMINFQMLTYSNLLLVSTVISPFKSITMDRHELIDNLKIIQLCRRDIQIYLNFASTRGEWSILSNLTELTKIMSPALCQASPAMNNLLYDTPTSSVKRQVKIVTVMNQALKACVSMDQMEGLHASPEEQLVAETYGQLWLSVLGILPTRKIVVRGYATTVDLWSGR